MLSIVELEWVGDEGRQDPVHKVLKGLSYTCYVHIASGKLNAKEKKSHVYCL